MRKRVAKKIFVLMTLIVSFLLIGTFLVSEICESIAFADIKNGGAIYVGNHSSATLASGTISGNTAENGGGVYVADGGTFTMGQSIRVDKDGNPSDTGDFVLLGSYPKTYQSDTSVITNKTDENGYYIGTDGTSRYALSSINPYESDYEFNGGKTIDESMGYFKVEPIMWRILSISDGKVLLLCEDIIDAHNFNYSTEERIISGSTVYANNYKYSDIRSWLNGYSPEEGNPEGESWEGQGFLQKAFTAEEQGLILETEVDNSASSTKYAVISGDDYACENTSDKIFLLSYNATSNQDYGLGVSITKDLEILKKKVTDFAIANSVVYQDDFYGRYWLRSPYMTALEERCVNCDGDQGYCEIINSRETGVVPAICISESTLCDNSISISGNIATSGKGNDIYNAGTFIMNSGTIGGEIQNDESVGTGESGNTGSGEGVGGNESINEVSTITGPVRVNKNGYLSELGDYVLFGYYPKTLKKSNVTIDETNVDSRGYYLGSDGNRYACVFADPNSGSYVFNDGTLIVKGNEYYFKVEPIKWRILRQANGKVLLLCEDIIDAHAFNVEGGNRTIDGTTIYENNYKYSDIRAWLNGNEQESGNTSGEDYLLNGFLRKAFKQDEWSLILTTTVDNSASSTGSSSNKYACDNTEDKIFLLSYQDLINTCYGFNSSDIYLDSARKKKVTDFALANNAYYMSNYYGNWWMRSPCSVGYGEIVAGSCVQYDGISSGAMPSVTNSSFGVVPALYISEDLLEGPKTGDEVEIGSYPTTIKADDVEIYEHNIDLNGYYLGSDGNRYAKVSANPYLQTYVFSDETTVVSGTEYYFKVEPLKWKILAVESEKVLLFCENIIDVQQYNYTHVWTSGGTYQYNGEIQPSNYQYSDIRAWLNGYAFINGNTSETSWQENGFLQKAFSLKEQNYIETTIVDNSFSKYGGDDTNDKIFLLSFSDVTDVEYGFNSSVLNSDGERQKSATDFAIANYARLNINGGSNGYWWLRSPDDYFKVYVVNYNGVMYAETTFVDVDCNGVVPAMYVSKSWLKQNNQEDVDQKEDSENKESQTIEKEYDIFNTGTMNLFGGTVYGDIYSETSFNAKMNANIKGSITLGNSATINVLDYAGETPEYSIIIFETRDIGTILTLKGSSVAPDLSKLDISGYDSESYKISVEKESSNTWNVVIEESNIFVRVDASGNVSGTGDYILFGSYPKTIKEDSVTIDESDVDSRGYYLGSDGNRYAKVVATPNSESEPVFSNQTAVVSGETYYFKVEKIKWRILTISNGKALLLAEDQLYGMFFDDEESNSNNYANSEVRAFLNGITTSFSTSYYDNGFLQTAFSTAEQNYIQTTTVDNSASTTLDSSNTYACENTSDKIFLLSYQESIDSDYEFSVGSTSDNLRQQKTTDFAVACGAYYDGCWWLRSPSSSGSSNVLMVDPTGSSGDNVSAHDFPFGVVPALWLDLGTGTSSFASNTENAKTEDSTFEKISNVLSVNSMFALVSVLGISKISTKSTINKPLLVENKKKRKSFKLASKKR